MQVNKYVHPCERFPTFLRSLDKKEFEKDYTLRENERVKEHLENFDLKIYELFFGNPDGSNSRIKRF